MTGTTRPSRGRPVRRKQADSELEERIERLEERLEESILGDDGLAALDQGTGRQGTDLQGADRKPSGDTLKRAVGRRNVKHGSRKA